MKSLLLIVSVLGLSSSLIAEKIDKKEYGKLLLKSQEIRDRILKEVNFEPIQQEIIRYYEQNVLPQMATNFTATTNGRASSPNWQASVRRGNQELEREISRQKSLYYTEIYKRIINTIAAYLNALGTPTAQSLLADLIANDFKFENITMP